MRVFRVGSSFVAASSFRGARRRPRRAPPRTQAMAPIQVRVWSSPRVLSVARHTDLASSRAHHRSSRLTRHSRLVLAPGHRGGQRARRVQPKGDAHGIARRYGQASRLPRVLRPRRRVAMARERVRRTDRRRLAIDARRARSRRRRAQRRRAPVRAGEQRGGRQGEAEPRGGGRARARERRAGATSSSFRSRRGERRTTIPPTRRPSASPRSCATSS